MFSEARRTGRRMAMAALGAGLLGMAILGHVSAVRAQEAPAAQPLTMTPAQLFDFADEACDSGQFATAESAYRALAQNPDIEIRSEARFRLAMMLADNQGKYREAAVEFRRILDEKPGAARVRLELARMHAQVGDISSAQREFRAAEATGLPPEVEQLVRFFANALNSRKAIGGSIEVALAPDTNINRATRSDTLGTVLGDFTINDNAKAKSGVGLDLRGQAYFRHGIEPGADLLVRVSTSADLYRDSAFNDIIAGVQVGPEYTSGRDRIALSIGPAWRWYGQRPYTTSITGNASWQHPTGKRSQLRVEGAISHVDNKFSDLQDSHTYTLGAAVDRALSAKAGVGLQVYGYRESARDPAYSTASGGVSAYLFRELGRTTLVGTLGYSHLEADARLLLFSRRRVEDRFAASLAATLRQFQLATFAPFVRVRWERNRSSVEIYDYRRFSTEFGLTSAF